MFDIHCVHQIDRCYLSDLNFPTKSGLQDLLLGSVDLMRSSIFILSDFTVQVKLSILADISAMGKFDPKFIAVLAICCELVAWWSAWTFSLCSLVMAFHMLSS